MTIRLYFCGETEKARLYMMNDGEELWIPKSVIESTVKFPTKSPLDIVCHELQISDWWWNKQHGDGLGDGDSDNDIYSWENNYE